MTLLLDYLNRNGIKQKFVAEILDIPPSHLCDVVNGKRRPNLNTAWAIQMFTGGQVPWDSWVSNDYKNALVSRIV